jgi:hypothetical protein
MAHDPKNQDPTPKGTNGTNATEEPIEAPAYTVNFNPAKVPEWRSAISKHFVHPQSGIEFWIRLEGSYPIDSGEDVHEAAVELMKLTMRAVEEGGAEQFKLIENGPVGQMIVENQAQVETEYPPEIPPETGKDSDIPF